MLTDFEKREYQRFIVEIGDVVIGSLSSDVSIKLFIPLVTNQFQLEDC